MKAASLKTTVQFTIQKGTKSKARHLILEQAQSGYSELGVREQTVRDL